MASVSELSTSVFRFDFAGSAVVCEDGREVSWAEFRALAEAAASPYSPHHVKTLTCRNDLETLAAFVGLVNRGVVPLMLPEKMDPALRAELERRYEGAPTNPDLALLLTTSGTTGSPKLVRVSRANLRANARICAQEAPIVPTARMMMVLPICYAFGLSVACSCLYAGATLIMSTVSVVDRAFRTQLETLHATHFAGVPYTYEILDRFRFFAKDVPGLNFFIISGGALAPNLRRKFAEWAHAKGFRFRETYGQTEATGYMALISDDLEIEKLGSIGRVIPEGRFSLEEGELVYEGPNVVMGYALSAEDLLKGDEWHGRRKTGDMATIDSDGYVFITGRASRFLKVFGCRVSLEDIEKIVKDALPGIECAATGQENRLAVFVTDSARLEEVRQVIVSKTHLNALAFVVRYVEALPRNPNGKIAYAQLNA